MVRLALILAFLLLAAIVDGASPVHLTSRSGYIGSVGSRFRFRIAIEQDAKNRAFCLQWASEQSEGQSCDSLDGERAPATIWREVTFRTSGEYHVVASLRRSDQDHVSNVETIRITGIFE